jgi:hypothetical protein
MLFNALYLSALEGTRGLGDLATSSGRAVP